MKILRFLCFLVFTGKFLHQAYVYKSDYQNGNLSVEFVINSRKFSADIPATPFSWLIALWKSADIANSDPLPKR